MKPSEYLALVQKGVDDEIAAGRFQNPETVRSETILGKKEIGVGEVYALRFEQGLSISGDSTFLKWGVQRSFQFTGRIYIPADGKLNPDDINQIRYIGSGTVGYFGCGYHFEIHTDLENEKSKVTYAHVDKGSKITLSMDIKDAIAAALIEIPDQIKRRVIMMSGGQK